MSLVRYELDFYIPEDDILHSDRREHLKSDRTQYVRTMALESTFPLA
jgi:hypothetical protein